MEGDGVTSENRKLRLRDAVADMSVLDIRIHRARRAGVFAKVAHSFDSA